MPDLAPRSRPIAFDWAPSRPFPVCVDDASGLVVVADEHLVSVCDLTSDVGVAFSIATRSDGFSGYGVRDGSLYVQDAHVLMVYDLLGATCTAAYDLTGTHRGEHTKGILNPDDTTLASFFDTPNKDEIGYSAPLVRVTQLNGPHDAMVFVLDGSGRLHAFDNRLTDDHTTAFEAPAAPMAPVAALLEIPAADGGRTRSLVAWVTSGGDVKLVDATGGIPRSLGSWPATEPLDPAAAVTGPQFDPQGLWVGGVLGAALCRLPLTPPDAATFSATFDTGCDAFDVSPDGALVLATNAQEVSLRSFAGRHVVERWPGHTVSVQQRALFWRDPNRAAGDPQLILEIDALTSVQGAVPGNVTFRVYVADTADTTGDVYAKAVYPVAPTVLASGSITQGMFTHVLPGVAAVLSPPVVHGSSLLLHVYDGGAKRALLQVGLDDVRASAVPAAVTELQRLRDLAAAASRPVDVLVLFVPWPEGGAVVPSPLRYTSGRGFISTAKQDVVVTTTDGRPPLHTQVDELCTVTLDASYGGQNATFTLMGASVLCALTNDAANLTDDQLLSQYETNTNTVLVPNPPDAAVMPPITIP